MAKLLSIPIRWYRRCISPNKPPCCKYSPTCSQYALDALNEWGAIRGLLLAAWRILRCNPFSKGGFDPVPINRRKRARLERKKKKQSDSDQKKDD
ncbi:MAG: membrane protein insertion efficiency factor YidD [Clostridia bacterium]|nr:membrane protein insertion efficiency factor YidD [Clostridia bacterium]